MKVSFIGLGYIGLPTAIVAAAKGLDVYGVDINPEVVHNLNEGKLPISEPDLDDLFRGVLARGNFRAGTRPQPADVFLIVVPTPVQDNHTPDISFVKEAVRSVLPYLETGNLLIIESTSPVGTTEHMRDLIFTERPELTGKIHIAYCPERVLPGNLVYELEHNDRVIGGIDPEATRKAMEFYGLFVSGTLHATNSRTAEMCKLVENSSRDVQIAFANELSIICEKAGIDVWELIALANKHPRVNILQPGSGVGGHCIAVDPYFIISDFPRQSELIATARRVNNYKTEWCIERIQAAVLDFVKTQGRKPVTALMGLAFKPDIDDLRESPAKHIVQSVLSLEESEFLIVEPNLSEHPVYKLTPYDNAYEQADIAVFLVRHKEFRTLEKRPDKAILDFCNVFGK